MEFEKKDLLTLDDITALITESMPDNIADLLLPKLKKYVVCADDTLYVLEDNVIFAKMKCDKGLTTKLSKYITMSYNGLNEKDRDYLNVKFPRDIKKVASLKKIDEYRPIIEERIKCLNVAMDKHTCEIHFRNGFINLKDGLFKPREFGRHYVSNYITYDYFPSKKSTRQELLDLTINKIIPIKKDCEYMLSTIAAAITGQSTRDNSCLLIYGHGSAGKSTLLDICMAVFQDAYVMELKSDLFSQSSSDYNKVLNSFTKKPSIRLSVCHELKDERISAERFKSFCEGKASTTILYSDGVNNITHNSKLFITANTIPNFIVDSGMTRRIDAYEQRVKFTDDAKEVNPEKFVYLKDKDLKNKIENDLEYKCAWVDVIVSHCVKYLAGEKIEKTENYQVSKNLVVYANDKIQDFIDAKLVLTGNEKDRVGKDKVHKAFLEMYKDKHLTVLQIITSLKEKGIKYNCDLRVNKIKGCFTGVKMAGDNVESDDDEIEEKDNQIKALQREVQELKAQLEALSKPPSKDNKKITVKAKESPKPKLMIDDSDTEVENFDDLF